MNEAKEPRNQPQFDNYWENPVTLGPFTFHIWRDDPKHLGFYFQNINSVQSFQLIKYFPWFQIH